MNAYPRCGACHDWTSIAECPFCLEAFCADCFAIHLGAGPVGVPYPRTGGCDVPRLPRQTRDERLAMARARTARWRQTMKEARDEGMDA